MNVLIWSKDNCSFCEQAKQLLKVRSIPFEERKIGHGWTKEQLLEDVPTARTVPQIFVDGTLIGGFSEFKTYIANHE